MGQRSGDGYLCYRRHHRLARRLPGETAESNITVWRLSGPGCRQANGRGGVGIVGADERNHALALHSGLFSITIIVIIGREITVSALREWMAEIGSRGRVAVSVIGKFKTTAQMTAVPFLLLRDPLFGLPIFRIGEIMLCVAAVLTLWSMWAYLQAAWPALRGKNP